MSKRTEHDPSLVLDPEEARRLARALQSPPKLGPEAEAELQRRAEESRATLPPKPAAWSPGGVNPFSGIVVGLFALLVMMTGEARADTRVLVDLYPEWQVREACRELECEGDLPPWWVDVCGEPQPPVSPNLPPVSEDDGEEPPLPPSGCWTTPSGQRLCPGEDGRGLTFGEFADLLGGLGVFDTEDGADDPTPTLDDPTERWGMLTEPDLKEACTIEVIDQPVSVQDDDGSSAAYLGGCEIVTCPGTEPVTTCCTGESLLGDVTCQEVDPTSDLYPYEPPATIWEALEWLLTLPGSGDVPAGYEGPWRYYLYTSATEGR